MRANNFFYIIPAEYMPSQQYIRMVVMSVLCNMLSKYNVAYLALYLFWLAAVADTEHGCDQEVIKKTAIPQNHTLAVFI